MKWRGRQNRLLVEQEDANHRIIVTAALLGSVGGACECPFRGIRLGRLG